MCETVFHVVLSMSSLCLWRDNLWCVSIPVYTLICCEYLGCYHLLGVEYHFMDCVRHLFAFLYSVLGIVTDRVAGSCGGSVCLEELPTHFLQWLKHCTIFPSVPKVSSSPSHPVGWEEGLTVVQTAFL